MPALRCREEAWVCMEHSIGSRFSSAESGICRPCLDLHSGSRQSGLVIYALFSQVKHKPIPQSRASLHTKKWEGEKAVESRKSDLMGSRHPCSQSASRPSPRFCACYGRCPRYDSILSFCETMIQRLWSATVENVWSVLQRVHRR